MTGSDACYAPLSGLSTIFARVQGLPRTRRPATFPQIPPPVRNGAMSSSAILTFAIIAGVVWGGFLLIVVTAVRKESRKAHRE